MAEIKYKQIERKLLRNPVDNYDKEIPYEMRNGSKSFHPKNQSVGILLGTFGFLILYLSLSICLTFYQKWVLKEMKYPFAIVMYHLITKYLLATTLRSMEKHQNSRKIPIIDFSTSIRSIAPTGIASGIDIGFSNWGLELVTVSLYTMTKSTAIVFILIFAIILKLEKLNPSLIIIVGMIAGGLFMFTYKSTSFNLFGFSFLLFASMASGIRWCFAQKIMQSSKMGLHNPVDMMFYMQPWMLLPLLPFMLGFEGEKIIKASEQSNFNEAVEAIGKITLGGIIAFAMEITEYLVLVRTSSLTLSIAGIFKEICQLVLAVELNGDNLSFFNVIGLVLCLGGISCHIVHKYLSLVSNPIGVQIDFDEERPNDSNKIQENSIKQNIPLLDAENLNDSDSDEPINEDKYNSSEVIFDILKRRDSRR